MIKATINNKSIEVEEETIILKAASENGITIPTLCYHPLLEPYSACRICVVEVEEKGQKKMVSSCNNAVTEGMAITTDSENVIKARKLNLELLMAQAPAAEQLKEMAAEMGVTKTRFPIIDETEKCILCGYCVGVCDYVVGAHAINFAGRGIDRTISTAFGKPSEACINCGACAYFCPTDAITLEEASGAEIVHSELPLGPSTAIRMPFMQSIPNVPFIDKDACIHFITDLCKHCEDVCEPEAINHDMEDEYIDIDAGTVVVATGYELLDVSKMEEYGYGKFDNVITSLEFEHLCNAGGPTGGKILLKNGKPPESIAIAHCVGSRDKNYMRYCSRICCMYAMKFAHLVHEKTDAKIYESYIDIRAFGKGYEEFYNRMLEEEINFIRGKIAEVSTASVTPEEEGKLVVRCEDTLAGFIRRIPVDMVILCPAVVARKDTEELGRLFGLCPSEDGFFKEQHPKLAPLSTASDGIFLAGACQSPKDIPDTVAQGAGAAGAVLSLGDSVKLEPIFSVIDEEKCSGCKICIGVCPYEAISYNEEEKISQIEETLCKGCGACVAACSCGASNQNGFTNEQILAEVEGAIV